MRQSEHRAECSGGAVRSISAITFSSFNLSARLVSAPWQQQKYPLEHEYP